ncbi:2-amino-4-hydroxy-6-hydroxymethyldihydropteridine pyrophosphokinase [termite gut metagenome]|uniref:2-amino-4-hydroxy-6-hydroxymethyldihydropteridine diphosphokinase n=1 Tax=termite gut metagenome TaxID=433724 RepID=A0A5J4SL19_9ZZZZ
MARVYLGLGSNLGNKEQNLHNAIQKIEKRIGKIVSLSAFYVTTPLGFISGNDFLNAVLCSESLLFPLEILKETQLIECEMGRVNKSVDGIYQDRLIDIDLLLYDRLIMKTEKLTLPHPLMSKRLFVMKPMGEIAPEIIHPVLGKKMKEILYSIEKTL